MVNHLFFPITTCLKWLPLLYHSLSRFLLYVCLWTDCQPNDLPWYWFILNKFIVCTQFQTLQQHKQKSMWCHEQSKEWVFQLWVLILSRQARYTALLRFRDIFPWPLSFHELSQMSVNYLVFPWPFCPWTMCFRVSLFPWTIWEFPWTICVRDIYVPWTIELSKIFIHFFQLFTFSQTVLSHVLFLGS